MTRKRYHEPKTIRMHSITKRLIVAGLLFIGAVLVIFCLCMVLRSVGKGSLHKHAREMTSEQLTQNLNAVVNTEDGQQGAAAPKEKDSVQETELKEGQIIHKGRIVEYNEDIMTFLCMGVDARKGISGEKTPGKGGQADAIMLMVADPHKESLQVININRDSVVEIEVYDTEGGYAGTKKGQIALQYAYGNGREESCELMEKAVSHLFYGIPIHGYVALDMEAIPILNDSVGGVTLSVLEDMTKYNKDWSEGAIVTLTGEDALLYIREREDRTKELGSNVRRIERQKQYLSGFAGSLREMTGKDITTPITLYGKIQDHMVTSLSVDEITYLATSVMGYDFSMDDIISIRGDMSMGKMNEEFHVDDEALRELIIETFYE